MMKSLVLVFTLVSTLSAINYDLDFDENGSTYKEKFEIFKQHGIIIYDVPKHGDIVAMKYLKDYQQRMNVMRDEVQKVCYIWNMAKDEPSVDSIEKGLQAVNGKFPSQRYMVENMNMFPMGEADQSTLSPAMVTFCSSYKILNVGFYTPKQMEKMLKDKLDRRFGNRTKRTPIHVDYFNICPGSVMNTKSLMKCYRALRPDLIQLDCKIQYTKGCGSIPVWTKQNLMCKYINEQYKCVIPTHTIAKVLCCSQKCLL